MAALYLLLLALMAGCSKHAVDSWVPPSQPLEVLSPRDGDTLRIQWRWPADSTQCSWTWSAGETRFTAHVTSGLQPQGSRTVQVFKYDSAAATYLPYGEPLPMPSGEMDVPWGSIREYAAATEWSDSASFYVELNNGDSVYVSPTITVRILSRSFVSAFVVPAPPILDSVYAGGGFVGIRWCDRSYNEDGFRIYYVLSDYSLSGAVGVGADTTRLDFTDYHPHREYLFWMTAFNGLGESPPSDTLRITAGDDPI